jgi:hypothetical protein
MYQVRLLAVYVVGGIEYCAFFHFCDTAGDTDDHFQVAEQVIAAADHFDHALNHGFGSLEIGDYAVFERAYRFNIFMGLFVHLHRPVAYRYGIAAPAVDGYN